jgi:hypothetical protein
LGLHEFWQVKGLVVDHGSRALIIRPSFVRGFWRHLAAAATRKKFSLAPLEAAERLGANTGG